jgi:hypothetical protein
MKIVIALFLLQFFLAPNVNAGINFKAATVTADIMIKEIGKEGIIPRDQLRGICSLKLSNGILKSCSEIQLVLIGPGNRQYPAKRDAKGTFIFTGLGKTYFNLWVKSQRYRLEKPIKNLMPGLSYSLILDTNLK